MRVVFQNEGRAVNVAAGTRLLDLCDEVGAAIQFSCRDASCATCVIEVVDGPSLLNAPNLREKTLLARLHAPAGQRLACQVTLNDGDGDLVIQPAPDPLPRPLKPTPPSR